MIRLNLSAHLGPCLQIAEGTTVELPDEVHDALDQRTNRRGRRLGLHRVLPARVFSAARMK